MASFDVYNGAAKVKAKAAAQVKTKSAAKWVAKAAAKAKAETTIATYNANSFGIAQGSGKPTGARVDVCSWCKIMRQGWPACDAAEAQNGSFYCEVCWGEFDVHQRNAGSACGGGDFWHEQILEAEIVAAEHEDDEGEEVFEFMKKAFDSQAMELAKKHLMGEASASAREKRPRDFKPGRAVVCFPMIRSAEKKAMRLFSSPDVCGQLSHYFSTTAFFPVTHRGHALILEEEMSFLFTRHCQIHTICELHAAEALKEVRQETLHKDQLFAAQEAAGGRVARARRGCLSHLVMAFGWMVAFPIQKLGLTLRNSG